MSAEVEQQVEQELERLLEAASRVRAGFRAGRDGDGPSGVVELLARLDARRREADEQRRLAQQETGQAGTDRRDAGLADRAGTDDARHEAAALGEDASRLTGSAEGREDRADAVEPAGPELADTRRRAAAGQARPATEAVRGDRTGRAGRTAPAATARAQPRAARAASRRAPRSGPAR